MLLSEAVALWKEQRRIEGYSPCTLRCYDLQMKLLMRHIGDKPADEVSLADLRGYIGGPASDGRKLSTIAHRVRMIRSFFTWCVEEDALARSPAHKLREPKLPQRLPKALTFDELELLRDACKTVREHALMEFLFATGGRAAEVSSIKRGDIDWDRRALTVLGKGNKEREVYFNSKAALWLKRYMDKRKDACPYLFIAERGTPRASSPHQLWFTIKRIAARVGLREKVSPHSFRHTMATTLLNQGASLTAVQSLLGHEKPTTTQLYAHLSGQRRQDEYRRFMPQ